MTLSEGLYREHLEEASALYEQRQWLLDNQQVPWQAVAPMEDRIEPHIDALVIGGHSALTICMEQCRSGDWGECHAGLSVMCRQDRRDLVESLLLDMDLNDAQTFRAVSDALSRELPESWQEELLYPLFDIGGCHAMLACVVAGRKRIGVTEELYTLLRGAGRGDTPAVLAALHALGRIRPEYGAEQLLRFLHDEDREVVNGAITALSRIGEDHALKECMAFIGPKAWPKRSLGFYGDRECLSDLFYFVNAIDDEDDRVETDLVLASGLIGNSAAVPDLIGWLEDATIAENAAFSLNLITGAELYEELLIPDTIDEDELFDDELDAYRKSGSDSSVIRPGTRITRISRNPHTWDAWWRSHKSAFSPEVRYRNGAPYSPWSLIANLRSEASPTFLRNMAYDELVIRYGIDFPFETDMYVREQRRVLDRYDAYLQAHAHEFTAGDWYYNGRLMSERSMVLTDEA